MPVLKRLNEEGIQKFHAYLSAGAQADPPRALLDDSAASELLTPRMEIELRTFANRLDAGRYLVELLTRTDRTQGDQDAGLWSWLSLFDFDQVCPLQRGKRHPGEIARHIPSSDFPKYYRHLLLGPYRICLLHGEPARLILHNPLSSPGDLYEQIASRQKGITNVALMRAIDRLYFDPARNGGEPKRGATTAKRRGNLRRLIEYYDQIDLTYDLYAMSAEQILSLLPP